ncbi:MAG TPA: histidine phosphatase family protein [Desulfobacterales bacterium]|nr:histidine phosphatase family protein [Desulfobacterales bacterium]
MLLKHAATDLFLARHGEVSGTGAYIGSSDPPLTEAGRSQALSLARALPVSPVRCLCSPLLRARQTAGIVARYHDLAPEYIADLREVDFGRWEGLTFPDIAASDSELVERWLAEKADFTFPEGENIKSFRRRVCALAPVLTASGGTLVVAHGGVIRVLICHFLGLELDNYLSFDVRPGGLTVLRINKGGATLTGFNL